MILKFENVTNLGEQKEFRNYKNVLWFSDTLKGLVTDLYNFQDSLFQEGYYNKK